VDVAVEISQTGPDIVIENGDLRPDRGIRTAALFSLFSDARATDEEIPTGDDPRGWWAEDASQPWGSKLWLLARAKRTVETLELARGYARAAFDWAVAAGLCERVDVTTQYGSSGELEITIRPQRGSSRRWQHLWTGEKERIAELDGVLVRILPD
jgi:phage gp46-like protein